MMGKGGGDRRRRTFEDTAWRSAEEWRGEDGRIDLAASYTYHTHNHLTLMIFPEPWEAMWGTTAWTTARSPNTLTSNA